MPLTMRLTGLASPLDEDRQDFTVYCGKWAMGRIYEERGAPDHLRWFWTLYGVVSASRLTCTRTTTRRPSKKPRLSSKARGSNGWPGLSCARGLGRGLINAQP
jgi:hypothetical protein